MVTVVLDYVFEMVWHGMVVVIATIGLATMVTVGLIRGAEDFARHISQ